MNKNNLDPTHFYNNGKVKEIQKQKSWFHTDVEFENSFKFWFALQWQNAYIQIFIAFFVLLILEIVKFGTVWNWLTESYSEGIGTGLFVTPFLFLPITGAVIVAYKGFWQYFNDIKERYNLLHKNTTL